MLFEFLLQALLQMIEASIEISWSQLDPAKLAW